MKLIAIFFGIVLSVFLLVALAFYNDSSRKFIIDYAVSYLQSESFSLKIEGANEKLTHVDKISARFSGNLVEAYSVDFERDKIFSRPRIQIKKVIFQTSNKKDGLNMGVRSNGASLVDRNVIKNSSETNSSSADSRNSVSDSTSLNSGHVSSDSANSTKSHSPDSGFDFRTSLSYVKKIKLFIESLKIAEVEIISGDIKRKYENFAYQSDNDKDLVSMKSTSVKMNPPQFNFVLDWKNSGNLKGDFQNIEKFSGNLCVNSLGSNNPKYEVKVGNSEYEINANGFFSDGMNTVIISKGLLQWHRKKLDFHGKILLNKNRANLVTKLSLSNFMDTSKIPAEITKNFQDISTSITIEKKEKSINSRIEFQKESRKLGHCNVMLQDKSLSVDANISWINFWGHKLKTLAVRTKNLRNFTIDILGSDVFGDDLKISSEIIYDKNISIQKLVCNLKKGKIILNKPFVLNESNLNTSFKFDLQGLGFLKKYFKIEGSAIGDLFFKNGIPGIDAKINQIVNENYELYNGKVSGNLNDLKIDVGSVKAAGNILKNLILKKKNSTLNFTSKLNSGSKIVLTGTFVDNVLRISGNAKNKDAKLELKNCVLDFNARSYKISSEISENRKLGNLKIFASPNKIDIVAENFSVRRMGKALGKILPECFINGSLKLSPNQDYFFGTGHFKIEKLVSRGNNIDINLKQDQRGLFIRGILSNATDNLRLESLIPVFIKRNLNFSIKSDRTIKVSVNGNASIENIFEFPDGITVKGKIKTDLNIYGSADHPKIQGGAECLNASVIISDVVLKNGTLKLTGQGRDLVVHDSYFADSHGKKAKINGNAALFFSQGIPNLNTNLQLEFDNFRLFDTDSMKINVEGSGVMSGPLDNLKLAGSLKVPLCELVFSESGDEDKYKDIEVTNDLFLGESQKKEDDFFSYDVNLESPLIKIIGNIYQLECAGNLHLGTYNREATLSGNIDLKKGKLNLFGKRMIFEKSKIEFLENYPFDPKMKLSCSRDIDTMKVVLDVKNNPGEGMSLDLHSHPNYTQDVILSYMMFGKSSRDLSVGEAAQLAHALNSMNRKGYIFSILNTFQNIGLVDSLSFSTDKNSSSLYTNSRSSSDKIHIRAGKYLSDNVYISVNQKEEETSFDVDLSVGSNTSLKVNTLGEVGVSWKFRY